MIVKFKFECQDCGFTEDIDNPSFVEKKCPCGGTMRAHVVAVSKK